MSLLSFALLGAEIPGHTFTALHRIVVLLPGLCPKPIDLLHCHRVNALHLLRRLNLGGTPIICSPC